LKILNDHDATHINGPNDRHSFSIFFNLLYIYILFYHIFWGNIDLHSPKGLLGTPVQFLINVNI